MNKRRVVVTGIGLVTPLGVGVDASWKNLTAGKTGIREITKFDASEIASRIAAEIPSADEEGGFDVNNYLDRKEQKKMGTFIHYGMAASQEAVKMASLDAVEDEKLKQRIGVVLGSGIGGIGEIEESAHTLKERGVRRISPFYIPSILINMFSGHVSMKYGFRGPNNSTVTACASGAHALGTGKRMIEMGEADVIVAGGSEAPITPLTVAGFAAAKALSTSYNDTPEKASRPFDDDRDGFVIGEGAGVLVLEEYEHAKARGAKIYAELAGFGQSGDAYHMTSPHPEGLGCKNAMTWALEDAGVNPSDVSYVNAHGTSTPTGDVLESQGIEGVCGKDVLVSSTKGATGHTLGAAGGIEAAFSVLAVANDLIPPTLNCENPSENCNLDYCTDGAREVNVDVALSNSFGFGGTNASLVFKKV